MITIATTATTIPKAKAPTEEPIVWGREQHNTSSSSTGEGAGMVKILKQNAKRSDNKNEDKTNNKNTHEKLANIEYNCYPSFQGKICSLYGLYAWSIHTF